MDRGLTVELNHLGSVEFPGYVQLGRVDRVSEATRASFVSGKGHNSGILHQGPRSVNYVIPIRLSQGMFGGLLDCG
jgi:hypothetical protein